MTELRAFDLVVLGGGIVGLWTAREAQRRGLRVCVIERGGSDVERASDDVAPRLTFSARENLGATRARHHVLTGNSAFWGGGLLRNPRATLARMVGTDEGSSAVTQLDAAYDQVETTLGIARPDGARFASPVAALEGAEITVLPGKRRALWQSFLKHGTPEDGSLTILTGATVVDVTLADGRLASVTLRTREGTRVAIGGETFVIALGVIDSCLFVQRFLSHALPAVVRPRVGAYLHDHWSIPVAELVWKNGGALSTLFPPSFTRQGIVGRRLAFDTGFFHVVADYDRMPPYDRVKRFLAARQRAAPAAELGRLALATMGAPWLMARAGLHYLRTRSLLVPDGTVVRVIVDFESTAHAMNRVSWRGEDAVFEWDVRDDDRAAFADALERFSGPLAALVDGDGVSCRWLATPADRLAMNRYFDEFAIDAYHLGGGADPVHTGVTNADGRIVAIANAYVMSTASFAFPGVANPVLTLLARSTALVTSLASEPK